MDTGISAVPDLTIAGGVSFVEGVSSYNDDNGHGTFAAGILAAAINGKGIVEMAPQADIYAVKVIGADGTGRYSSIIEGIEWCIDNHINIISMSIGGTEYSAILEDAINEAYENNLLVFASAGNNGGKASEDTITYPAKYDNVIAVGAVDENEHRASFSSVGPELELMAPGVDIKSTSYTGKYRSISGTSTACPYAAGIAVLLWSKDLSVSNEMIRGLMAYSAISKGDETQYGNGIVDAAKALYMYESYKANPADIDKFTYLPYKSEYQCGGCFDMLLPVVNSFIILTVYYWGAYHLYDDRLSFK